MTRMDVTDAIFEMEERYPGFEMICSFNENGMIEECFSSELPEVCWKTGYYEVIGYICPECGEPIYLDDYEEFDWSFIVSACPVCEFEFEQKGQIMERREEALNELEYVIDIISDLVNSFNIRTGKELYNAVFDYEYMFCDKGITINSGCTRLSFEPMDGEYLVKIQYCDGMHPSYEPPENWFYNYCELESEIYEAATKRGVNECLTWCVPLMEIGPFVAYAVERCEIDEFAICDEIDSQNYSDFCSREGLIDSPEARDKFASSEDWYEVTDELMMSVARHHWEDETIDALEELFDEYDVNDLHENNWGYKNGRLVVFDYGGYHSQS